MYCRSAAVEREDAAWQFAVCGLDPNLSGVVQDLGCYKQQVLGTGHLVGMQLRLLRDLLDQHNAPKAIDYLSLDTEGSEYEILSTFHRWVPRLPIRSKLQFRPPLPSHPHPYSSCSPRCCRYSFGVITAEHLAIAIN